MVPSILIYHVEEGWWGYLTLFLFSIMKLLSIGIISFDKENLRLIKLYSKGLNLYNEKEYLYLSQIQWFNIYNAIKDYLFKPLNCSKYSTSPGVIDGENLLIAEIIIFSSIRWWSPTTARPSRDLLLISLTYDQYSSGAA
jgi:hypothetical protein